MNPIDALSSDAARRAAFAINSVIESEQNSLRNDWLESSKLPEEQKAYFRKCRELTKLDIDSLSALRAALHKRAWTAFDDECPTIEQIPTIPGMTQLSDWDKS